jgi:hypothetical protein
MSLSKIKIKLFHLYSYSFIFNHPLFLLVELKLTNQNSFETKLMFLKNCFAESFPLFSLYLSPSSLFDFCAIPHIFEIGPQAPSSPSNTLVEDESSSPACRLLPWYRRASEEATSTKLLMGRLSAHPPLYLSHVL